MINLMAEASYITIAKLP